MKESKKQTRKVIAPILLVILLLLIFWMVAILAISKIREGWKPQDTIAIVFLFLHGGVHNSFIFFNK